MQHSEFYSFATHYWWLIFPVFSMIWGMMDLSARHRRATRGLDLVKSYIDQGKEPPPELLTFLQKPLARERREQNWNFAFVYASLFFAVLATAFTALLLMLWIQTHEFVSGIVFVIVLMAGFSLASFVAFHVTPPPATRLPPS